MRNKFFLRGGVPPPKKSIRFSNYQKFEKFPKKKFSKKFYIIFKVYQLFGFVFFRGGYPPQKKLNNLKFFQEEGKKLKIFQKFEKNFQKFEKFSKIFKQKFSKKFYIIFKVYQLFGFFSGGGRPPLSDKIWRVLAHFFNIVMTSSRDSDDVIT